MICNHCGERGIKDTVAHTRVCQGTPQEEIATLRASLAAAERARDEAVAALKEISDHLYLGNRGIDGASPSSVNWMRDRARAVLEGIKHG